MDGKEREMDGWGWRRREELKREKNTWERSVISVHTVCVVKTALH